MLLPRRKLQAASSTCRTGRSEEPSLQLYAAQDSLGDLVQSSPGPTQRLRLRNLEGPGREPFLSSSWAHLSRTPAGQGLSGDSGLGEWMRPSRGQGKQLSQDQQAGQGQSLGGKCSHQLLPFLAWGLPCSQARRKEFEEVETGLGSLCPGGEAASVARLTPLLGASPPP